MSHTILLVDDDKAILKTYKDLLEDEGYTVHQAESANYAAGLVQLNRGRYSLALVDYHMPGIMGDETTRILRRLDPRLQVITVTGDDSEDALERNVQAGSYAVLRRDIGAKTLLSTVQSYCKRFDESIRVLKPEERKPSDAEGFVRQFGMIGASASLMKACALIAKYAKSSDSVLIRGENGTGKEMVARAIHIRSSVEGAFVAVNCAAVTETLSDAEMFGHVRGAFTGAVKDSPGFFRQADNGTLFLDEIGDLSAALQAKLLRAIQEREVMPVGSTKPIKVNVRIIAATNVDLESAVRASKFREDLYYRINVLPINLEPLRNRLDDIEPLIIHAAAKSGKVFKREALEALKLHKWPGNIRELGNIVSRAVMNCTSDAIGVADLDEQIQNIAGQQVQSEPANYQEFLARRDQDERTLLTTVLKTEGSLSKAAQKLGIARTTLYDRLRQLGIKLNNKENE